MLIKLNENMGSPSLNFQLRQRSPSQSEEPSSKADPETLIRNVIKGSIFNDYIQKFEVVDPSSMVDMAQDSTILQAKNQTRKSVKIMTDHSSVVSGLKCLLFETAGHLYCNLSEDYFNVDAKPFVPIQKPAET